MKHCVGIKSWKRLDHFLKNETSHPSTQIDVWWITSGDWKRLIQKQRAVVLNEWKRRHSGCALRICYQISVHFCGQRGKPRKYQEQRWGSECPIISRVRTLQAPLTLTSSLSKIVLRWSQIVETDLGGEGTMSSDKSQCTENTQNKKSLGLKKQMIKQIWCAGRRFMLDCKRQWERGIPSPQKSKIQSSWR